MAKQRFINTRFWSDKFIVRLGKLERYLFLYFLTNEHTNICGVYELAGQTLKNESGFTEKELQKTLEGLKGKIYYENEWVFIKNFAKHQKMNESISKGVERALKELPSEILARFKEITATSDQSVPDGGQAGTYRNLNLNTNLNNKSVETRGDVENKIGWLRAIPESDRQELLAKFRIEDSTLRACVENLVDYCESKGKKYANYKAALRNFIKNHIERHPTAVVKQKAKDEVTERIEASQNRTPEEQARIQAKLKDVRDKLTKKVTM